MQCKKVSFYDFTSREASRLRYYFSLHLLVMSFRLSVMGNAEVFVKIASYRSNY